MLDLPSSVVGAIVGDRFVPAGAGNDARRQAANPAARLTGGIYVTRRDLLAEGRLGDVQDFGGQGDAADVDDLDEVFQAAQVHPKMLASTAPGSIRANAHRHQAFIATRRQCSR